MYQGEIPPSASHFTVYIHVSTGHYDMLVHYVMTGRELHQSLRKVVVFTQRIRMGLSGTLAGLKQQRLAPTQKCTRKRKNVEIYINVKLYPPCIHPLTHKSFSAPGLQLELAHSGFLAVLTGVKSLLNSSCFSLS